MSETEQRNKNRRQGFTLAELLVVVAIITILAGVSFVAVIRYQSRLKRLEMDQTAKEIFLASQNQLSLEYAQGTMERLLNGGDDERKLGIRVPASEDDSGSVESSAKDLYCILYSGESADPTDEIRNRLLPFGSIDETVRTNGSYLIFYEPETGSVRGVWYSDKYAFLRDDIGSTALAEAAASAEKREHFAGAGVDATAKGPAVGYYGGEAAGTVDGETDTDLKPVTFELRNDSALYAYVRDPNIFSTKQYGLKLYIEGVSSGARCEVDMKKSHIRQCRMSATGTDETSGTYRWLLDDITSSGTRFADLNKGDIQGAFQFQGTERFIPGENIRAYVCVFAAGSSRPVQTTDVQETNSLFQSVSGGQIAVSDIRHLENLDFKISDFDPVHDGGKIGLSAVGEDDSDKRYQASQQKTISWTAFRDKISGIHSGFTGLETDKEKVAVWYMEKSGTKKEAVSAAAGCFVPVEPQFALNYDGNYFAVDEIRVRTGSYAGLFGSAKKNLTVSRLTVRKPDITSTGIASAGGLIGSADRAANVELTLQDIMIQYPSVQTIGKKSATSSAQVDAGGAIGSFEGKSLVLQNVIAEDSFRTEVTEKKENAAQDDPLPTEPSEEEHHALRIYAKYGSAGGLIGSMSSGSLQVSSSAASVYVDARDYAGGLFGSITTSGSDSAVSVDACYVGAHTSEGKMMKTTPPVPREDAEGDKNEREFCAIKGRYNIVSRIKQAGGLAGVFPVSGQVSHSYVTASVYSFGDTFSGESEWENEPEADQSQKEAAFIGILGKTESDGTSGINGKMASDFPYCYSAAIVNGARAVVYSETLSADFTGEAAKKTAIPYDKTLEKKYPMPTVFDLMSRDASQTKEKKDALSKYVRVHIGDWMERKTAEPDPTPTPTPTPEGTTISNGNRLYVEKVINLPADGNSYLTFSVTGVLSKKTVFYIVNPVSNGNDLSETRFSFVTTTKQLDDYKLTPGNWLNSSNDIEKRLEYSITDDGKMKIRLYIDNLSVNSGGYQALWDNWNGANKMEMTAGEDIKIGVCEGIRIPDESEQKKVNSMFQEIKDNGDGTYTAKVSNARHLENLNFFGNGEWGHNRIKVTKVIQTDNILWTADDQVKSAAGPYCEEMDKAYANWKVYEGQSGRSVQGCFVPINNSEITSYDGGRFTIAGLNIRMGDAGGHNNLSASMFGSAPEMEIRNLKLKDPQAVAVGSGNAALLIEKVGEGTAEGKKLVLENIEVYGDNILISTNNGNQPICGGLVGSANVAETKLNHVVIRGKNVLVRRGNGGGTVGGLISTLKTDKLEMDDCVYSGYISGNENVEACGGLIGKLTCSDGAIKNSYTAGRNTDYPYISQQGAKTEYLTGGVNIAGKGVVGGLIGQVNGSVTLTQCFSTAGIREYSGNSTGTGGLIGVITPGTTSGVRMNSCYFAGNINGYGSLENKGTTVIRSWTGNTGIFVGSVAVSGGQSVLSMDSCTYLQLFGFSGKPVIGNLNQSFASGTAADPGNPDSMRKLLRPGTKSVSTTRYDGTLPENYPYQIWTTDEKGQYIYYGDWLNYTKMQ